MAFLLNSGTLKKLIFPRIITPTLLLRPFTINDTNDLFSVTDKNRAYLRRWLGWLDHCQKKTGTLNFIQTTLEDFHQDKGLTLGIWLKDQLVGSVGYNNFQNGPTGTIGYWLGERFQGQGIMQQSCLELIHIGFIDLDLQEILIRCAPGNKKSRHIPIKLGFMQGELMKDAEWHYDHYFDLIVYRLTRENWENTLLKQKLKKL